MNEWIDVKTEVREKIMWAWTGYIWLRTTTMVVVCEHGNDLHYTWTLREPQRNSFFALSATNLDLSSQNTMIRSPVRSATRSACLGLSMHFHTMGRSVLEACACSKLSKRHKFVNRLLSVSRFGLMPGGITASWGDYVTFESRHVPPGTHPECNPPYLDTGEWRRQNLNF